MRFLLLFFIGFITFPAFSAWQLDNQASALSFVTIKKGDVGEAHKFTRLEGSISDEGKVNFEIDLLSVHTNIEKRDERMREFLFNTDMFPKATFSAQLDMTLLNKIAAGKSILMSFSGDISLHGEKQVVNVQVLVAKLSDKQFIVSSLQPIILNANSFALVAGVKKLQELAKLPSISNAVPVSFVLTFKR